MGNQLAPPSKPGVEHSAELLNVVFKETLGPGRLLKSLLCLHDNGGLVVVKVFDKRKDVSSLTAYKQQLEALRLALADVVCPHVWPMQVWWETPHAGYMMRQHFAANLYERLSTRPFLTSLEKRWITFQLLHALSQAHARGVCHGDIKSENVMVTSWNWVFLTDFASYKPTYLPADNPADFSYYFDTGGRRRCYLAPERFFEGSPGAINTAAPLQPDMDVFSLGCVIAELWLGEGRAFFDLGTLLAYRRGEYDPAKELAAVEPDMAELVMHMIQRAPGDRWSADHYLTSWPRQLFPSHFSDVLHPFFSRLLQLDPDARLAAVADAYPHLAAAVTGSGAVGAGGEGAAAAAAAVVGQRGWQLQGLRSKQAPGAPSQHSSSSTPTPAAQPTTQPGSLPPVAGSSSSTTTKGAAIAGITPGAAAASSAQLLSRVDDLLSGAGSIQQRLLGGPGGGGGLLLSPLLPPSAEDDGICLDDTPLTAGLGVHEGLGGQQDLDHLLLGHISGPGGGAGGGGPEAGGAAGEAAAAAVEQWYEHQVREGSQQWVPHSPPGTSSSSSKEAVVLQPGWQWLADWQLQASTSGAVVAGAGGDVTAGGTAAAAAAGDNEGWQYSQQPPGDATATSSSWSPNCSSSNHKWRRRLWTRQRIRTAAAAAAAGVQKGAATAGKSAATPPAPTGAAAGAAAAGSTGGVVMRGAGDRDQGMVLLAVLLCSLLRGCRLQESKRLAMLLLSGSALQCEDDVRLQRVVPYLLTQLSDAHAAVRSLALRCAVGVMSSLSRLPPADARVYKDYLLPSLSLLPHDPEESVRVAYAQALAQLAAAARTHLLGMQYGVVTSSSSSSTVQQQGSSSSRAGQQQQQPRSRSDSGRLEAAAADTTAAAAPDAAPPLTSGQAATTQAAAAGAAAESGSSNGAQQQQQQQGPLVRYDAEMDAVRGAIERVVLELVAGLRSSPDIKRGLLSHADQLGLFFGRRATTDQLLPPLYTCLNDHVEWRLRSSFYGAIAALGPHTGHLDIFMLPYLEQALHDSQPAVSCDALRCWAAVCHHLPKRSLLKAARQVVPLLRHPSAAVRHSALSFLAAVARALPPADCYAQLAVMLAGHLQQQPLTLTDEEHLAACLQPPSGGTIPLSTPQHTQHQQHHHHHHQQQQQLHQRSAGSLLPMPEGGATAAAEGRRRVTLGAVDPAAAAAAAAAEASHMYGGTAAAAAGGLLPTRPGPAALQHSMSERPSSRGGGAAGGTPGRLSLQPSGVSPRAATLRLKEDFNTEGSALLLRPAAPVYCCDLDPTALGGLSNMLPTTFGSSSSSSANNTTTSSGGGSAGAGAAGAPPTGPEAVLPRVAGVAGVDAGVAGVNAGSSRCGYRAGGFGAPFHQQQQQAARAAGGPHAPLLAQQRPTATITLPPQLSQAGGGVGAVPAATAAAAAANTAATAGAPAAAALRSRSGTAASGGAAAPGSFWRGSSCAGGLGSRVLLTGYNTQLAVCPGGVVIGPSAAGSAAGRRPRPKSSHTAVLESLARRMAVLQEQYLSLAEAAARDPGSVEAADRQQMERLAATLHRLGLEAGHDVRSPAALLTYKVAAITSRAGPSGGVGGHAAQGASDPSSSVYDAVSAAMMTGIGQHLPGAPGREGALGPGGSSSSSSSSKPSWRPRGVLASHLMEHRAAVNCLATSANGALLLSGSDDETVKVWDVRRLEHDATFASRLTYAGQSGRITSVAPVLDGASVASASSSGSLHVWRVEYTTKTGSWAPDKYRGITALRQLSPNEGALLHVLPWANHPALLLYASQRGGVHCCDLRCAVDAWHVPPAPSLGLVTQLVGDPSGQHWLAQGSSRGYVCLWDVRFLLCVNSWQVPQRCSIQSMAAAVAAPPRLGLAAGSLPHAGVPLLYIAAGLQEVGLWDVLDGRCHQVLRVLSRAESQLQQTEPPAALQSPLPTPAATSSGGTAGGAAASSAGAGGAGGARVTPMLDAHLAVEQINTPQARLSSTTCLLPLPSGALLTGGADRCVRYWEPSWPERSYIVAGPVWPDDTGIMDHATHKLQSPAHQYRYNSHTYAGVPVIEERCLGDGPRMMTPDCSPDLGSKLRMQDLVHSDSITQLEAVQGTSKLLVSSSKDGCIKVWK